MPFRSCREMMNALDGGADPAAPQALRPPSGAWRRREAGGFRLPYERLS
jgi:hypothetical protein